MAESRGGAQSQFGAVTQQGSYWLMGLFLVFLSMRGLGSAATSGAPESVSSAENAPGTSPGGVASATPGDGGVANRPGLSGMAARCRAANPECCEGWKLVEEYRTLYDDAPTPGMSPLDSGPGEVEFRHLIATVPDPLESGHGDYFDAVLEGVEEAVALGGNGVKYVRDRSWLPWPGNDESKRALHCWDTEPGVLVYRATDDPGNPRHPGQSAIVVLLAGETPTWGLRPQPFKTALDLVDGIQARNGTEVPEYDVLGPTFSGTAASLSAVIRDHLAHGYGGRPPTARFSVVSGSATGPSVAPTIEAAGVKGTSAIAGAKSKQGGGTVSYSSTTPTDALLLEGMLNFIRQRGADCPVGEHQELLRCENVVLLTESLTAYGSGAWSNVREIKFPPNLASIRRAYQGVRTADTASSPPTRAPLDPQGPLKGEDAELSGDTPVTHDLALGEILRDLSRSRVRFVGIVATDARDVLFLAQRIRTQLPDIRLFTLGADIRYLHPDYAQVMNGMLVAHSTPLKRDDRSTSLQVEFVRNVFLAGRQLLGDEPEPPGVRVSLIGNGALWQIGADEPRAGGAPGVPQWKTTPRAPMSWVFMFTFFGVGFVVLLLVVTAPTFVSWAIERKLLDPSRSNGFLRHRGFLWALVGPCEHADLATDDRVVTSALLSVAAGPALLMAVAWFAREGDDPSPRNSTLCVAVAVVVIGALFWPTVRDKAHRTATPSALFLCFGATLATLLALGLGCGPQREATFNLLSGGSPVIAGLAALGTFGIGLWCWRVRLRFLDTHRFGVSSKRQIFATVQPPIAQALGEGRSGSPTGLAEIERRFISILRSPWLAFSVVPIVVHAALAVSVLLVVIIKPPHTFEAHWRNGLLVALGALALLPVTGNFSRLVAAWIAFARLLHRLAPLRAAAALRRLPERLARPLDAQLTISTSEIADLAYPVRALGLLSSFNDELRQRHLRCVQLLNQEQSYESGLLPDNPDSKEPNSSTRAELVECLLETSGELSRATVVLDETAQARVDDFVASLIAVFLPRYVRHFGLFVPPLVLGSMLSVLMTSLYFVQPQRLITSVIFLWVSGMLISIFLIYLALERDTIISAMGNTPAGSVTFSWGLVRRITSWGLLPIAGMFASQYPGVSSWVSTLFDVLTKGFR